jgi:GWxTD domain-containing protein
MDRSLHRNHLARNAGKYFLLLTVAVTCFAASGNGQRREPGETAQSLYYEAIPLPSPDPTSLRVDIHYRVDADFFVAIRSSEPGSPFRRQGELLVELIDSTGVSRGREIDRIDFGAASDERNPDQREWYRNVISLTVPAGRYSVLFQLEDRESRRQYTDKSRYIGSSQSGAGRDGDQGIFFTLGQVSSDTLTPQNFGGDLLFGSPASMVIPLRDADSSSGKVSYTIAALERDDSLVVLRDTSATAYVRINSTLAPLRETNDFSYAVTPATDPRIALVTIPFPAQQLPLRSFVVNVQMTAQGHELRYHRRFRTVWPDMPWSLRDVDYAIDVLRYIVSEEELDSLRRGNFEARRDALEKFWSRKDPTPATAYNAMMTEYYRRVDYAARHFGTLRVPDGVKSDRGRMYILHGPPTRTDRMLDPAAGFREVWVYEHQNKRFTFLDRDKSGNYVLVSPSAR